MRIGLDSIAVWPSGDAVELCLMAIGLGQPIGNVVVKDAVTGLFRSLTKIMGFGRRVIGAYVDREVIELERRPTPRRAPAVAARLVVAVALIVVASSAPEVTLAAALGAAVLLAGARLGRWAVAYVRREFVSQWRVLACTLGPALAFLAWVALRIQGAHGG